MKNKALFVSQKQDWETPKEFYDKLVSEFGEMFDPCPTSNYTNGGSINGLEIEWKERNYVNPPYKTKEQDAWVDKSIKEFKKGKLVVLLIPARTGTKRFHKLLNEGAEFRFLEGRLTFKGAKNCAPFDSMIVILNGIKNSGGVKRK